MEEEQEYPARRSPNRHRRKVRPGGRKCGRKQRFATEYEAQYVLGRMQARALSKVPVRYYYHARCDGFHITSQLSEQDGNARTWTIQVA